MQCASRVLPIPVAEIPAGLRQEVRRFDVPSLLTEPFQYRRVAPGAGIPCLAEARGDSSVSYLLNPATIPRRPPIYLPTRR